MPQPAFQDGKKCPGYNAEIFHSGHPMNLNTQFELIRQSATVAMADRILVLKAGGRNIIGLQVGDPDYGTHPAIAEAALKAI